MELIAYRNKKMVYMIKTVYAQTFVLGVSAEKNKRFLKNFNNLFYTDIVSRTIYIGFSCFRGLPVI